MKIRHLFDLILKMKKYFSILFILLKFFGINDFSFNNFDYMALNEDVDADKGEKKEETKTRRTTLTRRNMLIALLQITAPLRHFIYGSIAFAILERYADNLDPETVLNILEYIKLLDKSVVTFFEEMLDNDEDEDKNSSNDKEEKDKEEKDKEDKESKD